MPDDGLYTVEVTAFTLGFAPPDFVTPPAQRRYSVRAREVVLQELEWDAFVSGELSGGDNGHGMWRIAGVAGQVIAVEVNSEFNTVIGLRSPTGEEIGSGSGTARLLTTLENDGRHVIQIEAANALGANGESSGAYRVRTRKVTPRALKWNESVSARLGGEDHHEYGVWAVEGTSGERIVVEATADAFGANVRLLSERGEEVAGSNGDSSDSGSARV